MTGQPFNISNIFEFKWYAQIYFRDHTSSFPHATRQHGRCLGPADNTGTTMSQWVLNGQGNIIPHQTLRKLKLSERISQIEINKRKGFDECIKKIHGDSINLPPKPTGKNDTYPHDNDMEDHTMPDADTFPDYGKYINSEVLLSKDGEYIMAAKVTQRSRDDDGKIQGSHNPNPILDTRVYDVMLAIHQYAANIIAENIYSNVDNKGHQHMLLDCILDHRTITKDNAFIETSTDKKHHRNTTKGWYFQVQWKDASTDWISLKELKESNPVQVTDYCTKQKIDDKPALAWWVPYTLQKKVQIISAVNQHTKKTTHKYGVQVPSSLCDAYKLDVQNNN
jgi:hypothetical protein